MKRREGPELRVNETQGSTVDSSFLPAIKFKIQMFRYKFSGFHSSC
jgi:hypothetical protein